MMNCKSSILPLLKRSTRATSDARCRALEVIHLTGRKFSEQRRQVEGPYRLLTIGLTRPRPELYARVDARIEAMFAAGLLEEVQHLLNSGSRRSAVHVGHWLPAVCGCTGGPDGRGAGQSGDAPPDAHFIRRQANWFKLDDPSIHWFDAGKAEPDGMEQAIREFLSVPG